MGISGSRVAVIGGSIAGCAAAIALARAGCSVEVYERSEGALRDRGLGMLLPIPLRDELMTAHYLPENYPACRLNRRWWVIADGTETGRVLWEQPLVAAAINWGVPWRSLRAALPDENYHAGRTFGTVTRPHTGSGATKALQDAPARERAACAHTEWSSALREYDNERVGEGNAIVELGRRFGHAQVGRTPAWEQMTADDFAAWFGATLAGDSLYWCTDRASAEPVQP